MNQLSLWIQVLQALLAPTVAVGVGMIAYMQWRTAHTKVLLDLFRSGRDSKGNRKYLTRRVDNPTFDLIQAGIRAGSGI